MKWDHWIGKTPQGPVVMRIKHLVHIERWGFRIDLHKFIEADDPGCFHTHPAKAFRIVLWGGYLEEICHDKAGIPYTTSWAFLHLGSMGWVKPEFCHRIASLFGSASYSLWFRWRVTHKVELVGWGWPPEAVTLRPAESLPDDEQYIELEG